MVTEDDAGQQEPGREERPTASGRRPGAELAAARERAGMEQTAMAATLRLGRAQLEALERDDYQHLPAPAYVRGYLRAYAREVGLDGDDVVAAYEAYAPAHEDPRIVIPEPAEAVHGGRGMVIGLAVVVAVVLAGLAGWWWQAQEPITRNIAGDQAQEAAAGNGNGGDSGAASTDDAANTGTTATADASASAGDDGDAAAGAGDTAAAGTTADAGDPATTADGGDGAADEASAAEAGSATDASGAATGEGDTAVATAAPAASGAGGDAATSADAGASGTGDTAAADTAAAGGGEEAAPATGGQQATAGQQAAATTPAWADGGGSAASATAADAGAEAQNENQDENQDQAAYEPPDATASAQEATAPAATEGPDMVVLQVDGRSWIEVTDARGRELVYTLYSGSEPLQLRGWAPFDVFLGNSPDVEVRFGGEAVEKSAFTRSDQTARFLVDGRGARRR